jgi:hypothetical protein
MKLYDILRVQNALLKSVYCFIEYSIAISLLSYIIQILFKFKMTTFCMETNLLLPLDALKHPPWSPECVCHAPSLAVSRNHKLDCWEADVRNTDLQTWYEKCQGPFDIDDRRNVKQWGSGKPVGSSERWVCCCGHVSDSRSVVWRGTREEEAGGWLKEKNCLSQVGMLCFAPDSFICFLFSSLHSIVSFPSLSVLIPFLFFNPFFHHFFLNFVVFTDCSFYSALPLLTHSSPLSFLLFVFI